MTTNQWMRFALASESLAPEAFARPHGTACGRGALAGALWYDAGLAKWITGSPTSALRCFDAVASIGQSVAEDAAIIPQLVRMLPVLATALELVMSQHGETLQLPTWNGLSSAEEIIRHHAARGGAMACWLDRHLVLPKVQEKSAHLYIRAMLAREQGLSELAVGAASGGHRMLQAIDLLEEAARKFRELVPAKKVSVGMC